MNNNESSMDTLSVLLRTENDEQASCVLEINFHAGTRVMDDQHKKKIRRDIRDVEKYV